MDNKILRQLQLTELEILSVIDEFCKKYNIQYSLYAGTLLGAVRHKGFIPWDDDLDIFMSRENYNKFLKSWEKHPVEGYFLQNKEIEPDFTQSFSKIRKENTTFLQKGEENLTYHKGVFVDVFPVDRIPNGTLQRKIYQLNCMYYQLLTREFVPPTGNALVKAISSAILKCTPKEKRTVKRKKVLKKITRFNSDHNLSTIATEIMRTIKTPLPADLMDEYVEMEFEGRKFFSVKKWDEYLSLKFGDYMQLPPEEERTWRHLPLKIDFEHNM